MSDAVLPFPVLLTTIVAVLVSLVLILENQITEHQDEQVKQFTMMMAATAVGTKGSHKEVDHDDNRSGSMKQRMIQYDCDCVRRCIQQDYLGACPIFNHGKFQWVFHIIQGIYDCIKAEIKDHNFYNISDCDVTGHPTICIDC